MRDRFEQEAADLLAVLDRPINRVFVPSRGAGDAYDAMVKRREARRAARG